VSERHERDVAWALSKVYGVTRADLEAARLDPVHDEDLALFGEVLPDPSFDPFAACAERFEMAVLT
jgi:hypothetical protein